MALPHGLTNFHRPHDLLYGHVTFQGYRHLTNSYCDFDTLPNSLSNGFDTDACSYCQLAESLILHCQAGIQLIPLMDLFQHRACIALLRKSLLQQSTCFHSCRSKVGAAFDDKYEARKVRSGKYSLVDLDSFSSPPVSPGASKPQPKPK